MKIAAIYVRQSGRGETELSPAQQESACRRLPAVRECDSVEVYTDLNKSGGDPTRAGFLRLLARIEEGAVSVVSFYDVSRLTRDTRIGQDFTEAIKAHPGISVVLGDKSAFDVHTPSLSDLSCAQNGSVSSSPVALASTAKFVSPPDL